MNSPTAAAAAPNRSDRVICSVEVVTKNSNIIAALPNIPMTSSARSSFVKYVRNVDVEFDVLLRYDPGFVVPERNGQHLEICVETMMNETPMGVLKYDVLPDRRRDQMLVQPTPVIPLKLNWTPRLPYINTSTGQTFENAKMNLLIKVCWSKELWMATTKEAVQVVWVAFRDQEECRRRWMRHLEARDEQASDCDSEPDEAPACWDGVVQFCLDLLIL